MAKYRYLMGIFGFLIVVLGIGITLKYILVPKGFGLYGFYRAGALDDERAHTVVHQGKTVCASEKCHQKEYEAHEKDIHFSVQCEACHGPANKHVEFQNKIGDIRPEDARLFKELRQEDCLLCHRRLNARPKLFPTIDVAEHYALVRVKDPKTVCFECHSPHEPLFLDAKVESARLHPIIQECRNCHHKPKKELGKLPENHVVIFQCQYCHSDTVRDFSKKTHSFLDCTACHNFHRESEDSGRIFKNANPKFCLMCHEKKPFKDEDRIPLIIPKEHIEDVSESEADKTKRCADCHMQEYIHKVRTMKEDAEPKPGIEKDTETQPVIEKDAETQGSL